MTREEFIVDALKAAQEAQKAGAPIHPGIAAAQAALESGWGKSSLAVKGNNLFGIKAGKTWKGKRTTMSTKEWCKERGWYTIDADFRAYDSWSDCFKDYGEIIAGRSWYQDAAKAAKNNDARGFLDGLASNAKEPGWATDPDYVKNVWMIAKQQGLV